METWVEVPTRTYRQVYLLYREDSAKQSNWLDAILVDNGSAPLFDGYGEWRAFESWPREFWVGVEEFRRWVEAHQAVGAHGRLSADCCIALLRERAYQWTSMLIDSTTDPVP
jgi:hypothetical protein